MFIRECSKRWHCHGLLIRQNVGSIPTAPTKFGSNVNWLLSYQDPKVWVRIPLLSLDDRVAQLAEAGKNTDFGNISELELEL